MRVKVAADICTGYQRGQLALRRKLDFVQPFPQLRFDVVGAGAGSGLLLQVAADIYSRYPRGTLALSREPDLVQPLPPLPFDGGEPYLAVAGVFVLIACPVRSSVQVVPFA